MLLDDHVIAGIGELALLAPLHTQANLAGIAAARELLPDTPQVAVFDTTYHRTMPQRACDYAIPRELARTHGIHRYGFHGISHAYVAGRAAALLGKPLELLDLITLHLGAGASATAVKAGKSIDTSMGMTPLEGLVMATRCGDVDPAVPMLIGEVTGRSREDVHRVMNHESGLLGLCGTGDMREVHALADEGDADAIAALELYCYRVKKYIGAYAAALGHVDAVVFTAGVGENDARVREAVCEGLGLLGIDIDAEKNRAASRDERFVSSEGSAVAVLVVPTDEEREIARLALECVRE
jgi:acetate kinase